MKRILVIGPSSKTRGGISTLIEIYKNTYIWDKWHCIWVATYIDKSPFHKILYFILGFTKFLFLINFCQIVHIHFSWSTSLRRKSIFFIVSKLLNKKIVIHLHSGSEPIKESKFKSLYQYFFKNADLTLLLANSIKNELKAEFEFNKSLVLYNPATRFPNIPKGEWRNVILFAGAITEKKGLFDLIKAFSKISISYPSWDLLIIGHGEIEKMNQTIMHSDLTNRVKYLGWLSGIEKDMCFQSSSIFCLPSYTEGFPMSVIEAWSYGLPVITTPVGGLTDLLVHEQNCLLFTPGDVEILTQNLHLLISDESLRNKLSENSLKLINSKFDLDKIAMMLDQAYASL